VHEGDEPDVLANLRHADALAGKDVTEIHLASAESNPSTGRELRTNRNVQKIAGKRARSDLASVLSRPRRTRRAGARRIDFVALVVRQGLTIVLGGVAAGLLASLWLARFVTTLLYGVTARDGIVHAATAAIVLAVAGLAGVAPAWRAARLDPLRALRS
jgi:hypothetical protein